MLEREKRLEKVTTEPPVAAEIILIKYAFSTLAPRPLVIGTSTLLPSVLKSPVATRVASGSYIFNQLAIWPDPRIVHT